MNETETCCRVCLNQNSPGNLLPLDSVVVSDDDNESLNIVDCFRKYLQFDYNILFDSSKNIPTNICLDCFDRLLEVRKFYILVRNSENQLQQIDSSTIKFETSEWDLLDNQKSTIEPFAEEKNDPDTICIAKYENDKLCIEQDIDSIENDDTKIEILENENDYLENDCQSNAEDCNWKAANDSDSDFSWKEDVNTKFDENCRDSIKCVDCSLEFVTEIEWNIHVCKKKVGSMRRPYKCDQCISTFSSIERLARHRLTENHPAAVKGRVTLSCTKKKKIHIKSVIESIKKPVKDDSESLLCPECGKAYATASQLRVHLKVHRNVFPFQCEICSLRFKKNCLLVWHRLKHSDVKTIKCEYCDSYFHTKNDVRGHTNKVHLRPYHCNLCSRRVPNPSRLKKHLLSIHGVLVEDVSSYKKDNQKVLRNLKKNGTILHKITDGK